MTRATTAEGTLQTNINTKQPTLTSAELTSFTEGLNTSEVDVRVNAVVGEIVGVAPEALDTLGEIATALDNNASATAALVTAIALKEDSVDDRELIPTVKLALIDTNAAGILTKQPTLPVGAVGDVLVSNGTVWEAKGSLAATRVPITLENINDRLVLRKYDGLDGDTTVDYDSIRAGVEANTTIYIRDFFSDDTLTLSTDGTLTLETP